jgi:hypothetical protein
MSFSPCNGGCYDRRLGLDPSTRPLGGFAEVSAPAPTGPSDGAATATMVGMIVVGLFAVGMVVLIESGA